jgi:hypothetical protein
MRNGTHSAASSKGPTTEAADVGPSPLLRDDQWKVEKRYRRSTATPDLDVPHPSDDAAVGFLKYDVTNLAYALPAVRAAR